MASPRTRIDRPTADSTSTPGESSILRSRLGAWRRACSRTVAGLKRASRADRILRVGSRFLAVARRDGFTAAVARGGRKVRRKLNYWRRRLGLWSAGFDPGPKTAPYDSWQALYGANPRRGRRLADVRLGRDRGVEPFFSIIVPVYDPPLDVFRVMIESVLLQSYESWELVLADDCSPNPLVRREMEAWGERDPRIRPLFRSENGNISRATNHAAEAARGAFLVLVDHDDVLTTDALAQVALHLEENPETDLLYSDDDKIGPDGRRHSEQFKPDWSPELLLSFCYTGHLTAVSADLYRETGGMRVGFEGSQDHDFWLRAGERARRVGHIPQVLYHWRVLPGSTAASGDCKPASFEAGRRAVEEAFQRRGLACRVEQKDWAARSACSIFEPIMPDDGPSVALLIPTRNHKKQLELLLESLRKTTYRNYRVYVIDDESDDPETLDYLAAVNHRILRPSRRGDRFNYAAINNEAARCVEEDLLVFLNDDVEVIEPRWLSQMAGWSRLPGVGAVGARLLYPDGRVQHAGIVHGFHHGLAGTAFKLLPRWDPGTLNLAKVARNCSAVTAACMLTPRRLFLELGGFDEERFAVAYNDADYGYRLVDAGRRVVYCAEAELLHHEGTSRGFRDDPREVANYREAHGRRIDPYFSPHLDPEDETFRTKPTVVPISRGNRPVAVVGVTHNLNWEGAPRFEYELLTRQKAAGAISPIVLSPVDGPLSDLYREAGVPVHIDPDLQRLSSSPPGDYRKTVARLAERLRKEGCEVVHANTMESFWAVDAARLAGVPSVWSVHESEPWRTYFDAIPPENAAAALSSMAHPYRVVFTAESTAQVWSDFNTRGNFSVIHYALDVQRFRSELASADRREARAALQFKDDEVCVLTLGTVCERKGQKDLLHAFKTLPVEVAARMRCVVVGARDSLAYCRELRDLAGRLPADRRDRFLIVDETGATARYWLAADVFCCSSRIESYPHVTQEAMAAGLPLVTTPVFGISEQVKESVNALIYRPGDVQTLARHIEKLTTDGRMRREYAAASPLILQSLPDPSRMDRLYRETIRAAAESAPPAAIATQGLKPITAPPRGRTTSARTAAAD